MIQHYSLVRINATYDDSIFVVLDIPQREEEWYTIKKIWDMKLSVNENVKNLQKGQMSDFGSKHVYLIPKSVRVLFLKSINAYVLHKNFLLC